VANWPLDAGGNGRPRLRFGATGKAAGPPATLPYGKKSHRAYARCKGFDDVFSSEATTCCAKRRPDRYRGRTRSALADGK